MNYIRRGVEPVLRHHQTNPYGYGHIRPEPPDYAGRFWQEYEESSAVRTMVGSCSVSRVEAEWQYEKPRRIYRANRYLSLTAGYQASTVAKDRQRADDWARFFYQPVIIYSHQRKMRQRKKPQNARYELVELSKSSNYREFAICEVVTSQRVKWVDFPDVNTVREYLKIHGFPEDNQYSKEEFLQEVEHGHGEMTFCVGRRQTAESILNLVCYALIHKPVSYSNKCKGVNRKMDENTQEKLASYLELLSEIKEKTTDERTAAIVLQELSKDRRIEAMHHEREAKNGVPATDKQKRFMTKLGISYPATVTKQEASQLIDEELGRNGA